MTKHVSRFRGTALMPVPVVTPGHLADVFSSYVCRGEGRELLWVGKTAVMFNLAYGEKRLHGVSQMVSTKMKNIEK